MNFSSLIVASFALCLAFASPAHASTVNVQLSSFADPIAYPDSGSKTLKYNSSTSAYSVWGYLAPDTTLTMTYDYSLVTSYKMYSKLDVTDFADYLTEKEKTKKTNGVFKELSSSSSASDPDLLFYATVDLESNTGTTVITNLSDSIVKFTNYFEIIVNSCSKINVYLTYNSSTSNVPLPSAIVLFAPALAGMAGFAKRKKA
ncbi:MAG: hypothetical protein WC464_03680 [Bdellovibrionales bacterium]